MANELVNELAYSWLEMHKKSAVTFLVLSALEQEPMWSETLRQWVEDTAGWDISEKALYRTLKRLDFQGLVTYTESQGHRTGANRKVYELTDDGKSLLEIIRKELRYLKKLEIE